MRESRRHVFLIQCIYLTKDIEKGKETVWCLITDILNVPGEYEGRTNRRS